MSGGPGQSQLMQQQYAAGLRIKQSEKTGNFYKHIYCNSVYRQNATDIPSNYEVFLQNEIVVPPDGNTRIKIHRANIPMTFNNVVKTISFTLSAAAGLGADVVVTLSPGFYNPAISETVSGETFDFGLLGRINRRIFDADNSNLLRAAVTTSNKLRFYIRGPPEVNPAVTLTFSGADVNYTKRVLGFGVDASNTTTMTNFQSPYIYGPYFYSELFIRISSIPINYDLVDMRTQAPADILAVVPINVDTFGQIITVGPHDSLVYNFAPNSRVARLRLQLTYADGTLVDTQNQDWSCVLSIVKENPDDINPSQLRTPLF